MKAESPVRDLDEAEEMTVKIGGVITTSEDLDKEKTEAEVEENSVH